MCAVAFTFFRDVKTIVQMMLMLAFFSSPILFRADAFEAGTLQARLIQFHPVTYFAALFQKPIYHGVFPNQTDWMISFGVALTTLALGAWLINKYKGEFYYYL
jgi:ABC-type polysaccharide/polyol phosphate export permease